MAGGWGGLIKVRGGLAYLPSSRFFQVFCRVVGSVLVLEAPSALTNPVDGGVGSIPEECHLHAVFSDPDGLQGRWGPGWLLNAF